MAFYVYNKRKNALKGGQFANMQNLYPSHVQTTGIQYPNYISCGPGAYPPHYQGQAIFDYKRASDMFMYDHQTRANQPAVRLVTRDYYMGLPTRHRTRDEIVDSPVPRRRCPSTSWIVVIGLFIFGVTLAVSLGVVMTRGSEEEAVQASIIVTYGGSLRMGNKVFTNELYNPNSLQFKNMEKYVCNMIKESYMGTEFQNSEQICIVTRFSNGSVDSEFMIRETVTLDSTSATSNKTAQEVADERVKMRLEILTNEAEKNPNMETPTLKVMDVAEQESSETSSNNVNVFCSATEFECQLGGCVDQSKKCNGFSECTNINFGDTSDETGCVCIVNKPCENEGTCSLDDNSNSGYNCTCAEGYAGSNCQNEIPCEQDNPCQNGGTCSGTTLRYNCSCDVGYTGRDCKNEIPCNHDDRCQNGGTCSGTVLSYQCSCTEGHTGTNCENEIPCNHDDRCQNGGTCSGTVLSYQCSCTEGHTGTNCENEMEQVYNVDHCLNFSFAPSETFIRRSHFIEKYSLNIFHMNIQCKCSL